MRAFYFLPTPIAAGTSHYRGAAPRPFNGAANSATT